MITVTSDLQKVLSDVANYFCRINVFHCNFCFYCNYISEKKMDFTFHCATKDSYLNPIIL